MTARPEITATNYQNVYAYYETPRLHAGFNRAVFALSNALYSPDLLLPEDTEERIIHQLLLGKGALIAANHPSQHDPFVAAAAMRQTRIPELQQFMGLAKDSLFRGITLPLFEKTGCIPVFRSKSYPDVDRATLLHSTERMLGVAVHRLRQGDAVALMPEGTRSPQDGLREITYERVRSGIARVAQYATDTRSFILPVGIFYRTSHPRDTIVPPRHAVVAIGEPITEYGQTTHAIRHQVQTGIQAALTTAIDHTRA